MEKRGILDELHKNARKNFTRRAFDMRGIDETFQADLIEFIPLAYKNKRYKYILVVIDTFSKFAWAKPLKNKTGIEVTNAMKLIFRESKRIPKNLQTDQGKEFYNKNFTNLMKEYNINHYSTYSKMKASIVERFNRTLMSNIFKNVKFVETRKWVNILQEIMNRYNHTKHRTIKCAPIHVNKQNEIDLLENIYQKNSTLYHHTPKFKENDCVRISKYKTIFEKGYTPNWSSEIFRIKKILPTSPITYLLNDMNNTVIKGSFYEYELQKTKYPDVYFIEKIIRRKGNQLYIKWLGHSDKENSWINKKDII